MLYLERPRATVRVRMHFGRALLIQRLEESRPHEGLCTLNGADRVQRFKKDAVIGMICRSEGGMERRTVGMRRQA